MIVVITFAFYLSKLISPIVYNLIDLDAATYFSDSVLLWFIYNSIVLSAS